MDHLVHDLFFFILINVTVTVIQTPEVFIQFLIINLIMFSIFVCKLKTLNISIIFKNKNSYCYVKISVIKKGDSNVIYKFI